MIGTIPRTISERESANITLMAIQHAVKQAQLLRQRCPGLNLEHVLLAQELFQETYELAASQRHA